VDILAYTNGDIQMSTQNTAQILRRLDKALDRLDAAAAPLTAPRLLTIQEAATALGVSRDTVRRMCDRRDIGYVQTEPGTAKRIPLGDLQAWIDRHATPPLLAPNDTAIPPAPERTRKECAHAPTDPLPKEKEGPPLPREAARLSFGAAEQAYQVCRHGSLPGQDPRRIPRMTAARVLERKALSGSGAATDIITVELPSGMVLHGCLVLAKDGRRWVSPPSRVLVWGLEVKLGLDGKPIYDHVVTFASREKADAFSRLALAALDAHLAGGDLHG
jgi:excisionase family DNA binding protein